MTKQPIICNVCTNAFSIDPKQEMENHINYVKVIKGKQVWICFKCQEISVGKFC